MQIESLIHSLHKINAIQFGEFKLKSGQFSPIYINLRKIISYPELLRTIATIMWQQVATQTFDLVCGVPYTALPIATTVSLDHQLPMIMRRKEKKDYGTKQSIEGVYHPGQTCLLLEDIITTGSSLIETATELEDAGLTVTHMVALVDRQQGGKENLAKKYAVHTVITMEDILTFLSASPTLTPLEQKIVEKLYKQPQLLTTG